MKASASQSLLVKSLARVLILAAQGVLGAPVRVDKGKEVATLLNDTLLNQDSALNFTATATELEAVLRFVESKKDGNEPYGLHTSDLKKDQSARQLMIAAAAFIMSGKNEFSNDSVPNF